MKTLLGFLSPPFHSVPLALSFHQESFQISEVLVYNKIEVIYIRLYTIKGFKINSLEHHGIKGKKWGIRNGPPYPLDPEGQYMKVSHLNTDMNNNWNYGSYLMVER